MIEFVVFGLLLLIGYLIFLKRDGDGKVISNMKFVSESIKGKIRNIKHAFNMSLAIAISIILFIFSPDKFYFFIFVIIFGVTIYYAMQKIANLKHILTINFKNNRLGLYQVSQKKFNEYEIVDEAGRPASINYKLYGNKAEIIIADDMKRKKIVVNPVCSNIEFVRDYKNTMMDLKRKMNEILNKFVDLKAKLRYETLLKSVELLERVSVIDKINPFEDNGKEKEKKVITIDEFKKKLEEALKDVEKKVMEAWNE
ncbi:MAG TPA: hypothetical protein ENI33_02160 [Thermoplasmatales archaeon]|nr:hypothetical protein [Thermoplasmatales archaeon]